MPWAGDGNIGTLLSNVPRGWVVCNGAVVPANRYPLLSSILGNSYGGTNISGEFPHYSGTIKIPDLTGRVMMDLEPSMLFQAKYQQGQSDAYLKLVDSNNQSLVIDDGLSKSIPTLISSDTNLTFTISSDLVFNGKIKGGINETNITLTDPAFSTTIHTIGRKLGINHTPYHKHPGSYSSAVGGGGPPELYRPSAMQQGGSISGQCATKSWYELTITDPDAPTWCNGAAPITYFDDTTLIETSQFNEFISTAENDYSQIPSLTAGETTYESASGYTETFSAVPKKTHAQVAWEGVFPRPIEFQNRRNYFGINTGNIGPGGLQDDPENFPTLVANCIMSANATSINIPPGIDIGADYDKIQPFMLVTTELTGSVYLLPGTQVTNITQNGNPGNYGYNVELSQAVGGTGTQSLPVSFRHGVYPTTINGTISNQDPASTSFQAHNHGTFELLMGKGLKGPTTHPVNDLSKGTINAEPINGALNIIANIANPSLNIVYIIRAY